ncbi:hypothetical protein ACFLWZ_00405 [Chloroflexota bacterium]
MKISAPSSFYAVWLYKGEFLSLLNTSQSAIINVPNLERFIEDIQKRLPELDFEGKRLALEMLGITVWLDGENIEGIIELEKQVLRCSSDTDSMSNVTPIPFSFKLNASVVK